MICPTIGRRRWILRAAVGLQAALMFLTSCGSDASSVAGPPFFRTASGVKYQILLRGDTLVALGSSGLLTATLVDSTGGTSPAPSEVHWTVSDASVLTFSTDFDVKAKLLFPRAVGTVTIVISSLTSGVGYLDSITVRVVDPRPVVVASLGQTVNGNIKASVSDARYALDLNANDVIDVATTGRVTLRENSGLGLPLAPTLGSTLEGTTIFGRVVAPKTGRYLLDAWMGPSCKNGNCSQTTGAFVLSARRAGPILQLGSSTSGGSLLLPQGRNGADTIYVQNVGTGSLTLSAVADSAFLVPTPSVVATGMPSPGASPLVIRTDAALLGGGQHVGVVTLTPDTSVWTLNKGAIKFATVIVVYDSALVRLPTHSFNSLAPGGSGTLLGVDGSYVYAIDTVTGVARQTTAPSHDYVTISGTANGVVFVSYDFGRAIARLMPDLSLVPIAATTVAAFAAAPDGSFYSFKDGTLSRLSPVGTNTTLLPNAGGPDNGRLTYSERDNALYYSRSALLRRYNVSSGIEETLGSVDGVFAPGAVDAQGRIYGFEPGKNLIAVADSTGKLITRIYSTGATVAVTVVGGNLFGGGLPTSPAFWRRPTR